jgi:hypothetical protein
LNPLATINLIIAMDFTRNFGHSSVNLESVFQDTKDTSSYYRTDTRIYHPLCKQLFDKRFKLGDRVKMHFNYDINHTIITCQLINIIKYEDAKKVLGSYNATDTGGGYPFTHVLILEPY